MDADGWINELCARLQAGLLDESVELLADYARRDHPDRVLDPLMVRTIRRIESDWSDLRMDEFAVTRAFATARQVIELWQTRRTGALPHRPGVASALPLLVAVVPGDGHTFGSQILTDALRLRGWEVETHIAPPGPEALIDRVHARRYGALLISVGQDDSLAGLGDMIAEIRLTSANRSILTLVGGAGLAQPYAQYHFLRADMIAGTAEDGANFLMARLPVGPAGKRN